jgi:hypothetical protein
MAVTLLNLAVSSQAKAVRILDGYAGAYGYTGTDPDGAAETKLQFLQWAVVAHIKGGVVNFEANSAASAAANAARQAAETDVAL